MLQHAQFHFHWWRRSESTERTTTACRAQRSLRTCITRRLELSCSIVPTPDWCGCACGERGWDYSFQGQRVSHKVGLTPQPIAALWDAMWTDDTHGRLTFRSPICVWATHPSKCVSALRPRTWNATALTEPLCKWSVRNVRFSSCDGTRAKMRRSFTLCGQDRTGRCRRFWISTQFGGLSQLRLRAPADLRTTSKSWSRALNSQLLPWSACSPERLCVSTLV